MQETQLHIKYCETFNIPLSELQNTEELQGTSPPSLSINTGKMPDTDLLPLMTACTAYTRYVLDVGQSQDWLAVQVALAPCLLGYGAVAQMLRDHAETKRDGNPYWSWIEAYISDEYAAGVDLLNGSSSPLKPPLAIYLGRALLIRQPCRLLHITDLLEKHMPQQSSSRIDELVQVFIHATRVSSLAGQSPHCSVRNPHSLTCP